MEATKLCCPINYWLITDVKEGNVCVYEVEQSHFDDEVVFVFRISFVIFVSIQLVADLTIQPVEGDDLRIIYLYCDLECNLLKILNINFHLFIVIFEGRID